MAHLLYSPLSGNTSWTADEHHAPAFRVRRSPGGMLNNPTGDNEDMVALSPVH